MDVEMVLLCSSGNEDLCCRDGMQALMSVVSPGFCSSGLKMVVCTLCEGKKKAFRLVNTKCCGKGKCYIYSCFGDLGSSGITTPLRG